MPYHALRTILEIQELDIKLIRLMELKEERKRSLAQLQKTTDVLLQRGKLKEEEILEIRKLIRFAEGEHQEIIEKIKKLEGQQHSIKKLDEYHAITNEISSLDRSRLEKERGLSDLYDQISSEEVLLKTIQQTAEEGKVAAIGSAQEIQENLHRINAEGRELFAEREKLAQSADFEILKIYEKLLAHQKDRVVVSLEQRCCSGCHIMLTAQHENLVRKGERLVFCEHCSRIHYWDDAQGDETASPKGVRRRRSSKASV